MNELETIGLSVGLLITLGLVVLVFWAAIGWLVDLWEWSRR